MQMNTFTIVYWGSEASFWGKKISLTDDAYKDLLLTISTSVSQYAILDPALDC